MISTCPWLFWRNLCNWRGIHHFCLSSILILNFWDSPLVIYGAELTQQWAPAWVWPRRASPGLRWRSPGGRVTGGTFFSLKATWSAATIINQTWKNPAWKCTEDVFRLILLVKHILCEGASWLIIHKKTYFTLNQLNLLGDTTIKYQCFFPSGNNRLNS